MKLKLKFNLESKNALWLIAGRILQSLIALIVGILTARFLGPSNYGLISYGLSFVAFFMSLYTLGINSIIVKELFDNPNDAGKLLGSTIGLRIFSSILSIVAITLIVSVLKFGDTLTLIVTFLCALSLFFDIFSILNYWFQYNYKSKNIAIATFIGYLVASVYKIILLINGSSVKWFAFSTAVNYMIVSIILLIIYKKTAGPKFSFSFKTSKFLLKKSYNFILAGVMVSVYTQIDKVMISQFLGESSVGYYSVATVISGMWVFVLAGIIDAVYPTILKKFSVDQNQFNDLNRKLYAIIFYLSFFVFIFFLIFGDLVVSILYGSTYEQSAMPLKIVAAFTGFSYLGVARNAWLVCMKQQKYLKYFYLIAAISNVVLNLVLIPHLGISGAALASFITQLIATLIIPYIFKGTRENTKLMLEAIMLKKIINFRRNKNV